MITTNLTLTNGATSEVPIRVVGITFEVDSKLAVNPSVVFPLTIAIDSSEIIGIDFDETLYTGDYTESITINTLGGRHDIVHTVEIVDDTPSVSNLVHYVSYGMDSMQDDEVWMNGINSETAIVDQVILDEQGLDNGIRYSHDTATYFQSDTETSNNSGFLRDSQFVMSEDGLDVPKSFTLSGLDDAKTYTLRFSGSRNSSGLRETSITIDGDSKHYVTTNDGGNVDDGVEFISISPISGSIVFTAVSYSGAYYYVGGFDIIIEGTGDALAVVDLNFNMTTVGNQHFLGNDKGYDLLMYTGAGANLVAGQEIVVSIADTYQTICYMLDGVVHYDTGSFFAGDYTINKIGIVQNFFFYDGIFTTEEKAYLEYYPDRFLYKNGDVLDSGILTPTQLALVRAYFPMCENGDSIVSTLSGISYIISNYTAEVRSTGNMLTHGLTAFTERDDEGVVL